jgi:hypothetical protein
VFPVQLSKSIRSDSLKRIGQHTGLMGFSATEIVAESTVYAHWTSLVLVGCASLRLLFKAHFNSVDLARELDDMEPFDLMREYCNLMGGVIKPLIEGSGIPVGVSLPLITRGFDEVFVGPSVEVLTVGDRWVLERGDLKIWCCMRLEILDEKILTGLASLGSNPNGLTTNEVEFF